MRTIIQLMKSETLLLGLAMFCMFFGAGNVIFPLYLGQSLQSEFLLGCVGMFFTAVIMPFTGVFIMILLNGDTVRFFGRFGRLLGLLLMAFLMMLLGPLGSTPRCVALSLASFQAFFPNLNPEVFIGVILFLLYFATKNRELMMKILGRYVTPILLSLLAFIIIVGFVKDNPEALAKPPINDPFIFGVKEGYNTMDLLAAFFFSSSIVVSLRKGDLHLSKKAFQKAIKASLIGALLLSLTYLGFAYVAAKHAGHLLVSKEMILHVVMQKLVGHKIALIVAFVVSLACLTTAMALLAVFTDFVCHEVKALRNYPNQVLLAAVIMTGLIARLKFQGISGILTPLLVGVYPVLIFFTLFQLFEKTVLQRLIKLPIFNQSSKL